MRDKIDRGAIPCGRVLNHFDIADHPYEKTKQIPGFFVATRIFTMSEFDSEVGDLPEIIPLFSNARGFDMMLILAHHPD